jgi:hypothetical protein
VLAYSLTVVHGLKQDSAANEIITFSLHSVQYFITYSGKYMYHLLYHLRTRLVRTVFVSIWFSKQTVINRSIFVMQMHCVYCDARIENLYIIKAVKTLYSEGLSEQAAEGPPPPTPDRLFAPITFDAVCPTAWHIASCARPTDDWMTHYRKVFGIPNLHGGGEGKWACKELAISVSSFAAHSAACHCLQLMYTSHLFWITVPEFDLVSFALSSCSFL